MNTGSLYFRQLLSGRDFARTDQLASQMVNFAYLIGDTETRECVVVDPAYGVDDILQTVATDEMKLVGVLASHFHSDHVGGAMSGYKIEGIAKLLEHTCVPIHINSHELPWITRTTGVEASNFVLHPEIGTLNIGSIVISLCHTPGHTPGSQCFLVNDHLLTGDTLFIDGCGRTDLPGGNQEQLLRSLDLVSQFPQHLIICPGHRYSAQSTAVLADVIQNNSAFAMALPPLKDKSKITNQRK